MQNSAFRESQRIHRVVQLFGSVPKMTVFMRHRVTQRLICSCAWEQVWKGGRRLSVDWVNKTSVVQMIGVIEAIMCMRQNVL